MVCESGLHPLEHAGESERGALQVATCRRDVGVAEEVPYIVQVRPRFEQGAGELPPQVMEVQIDTAEDPLDSRDNFPSAIQSGV